MTADTSAERGDGHMAGHLSGIEALRAYAAFAIVIFHITRLTDTVTPSSLEFAKNFFGFGVPLFFVVSAFALAYGFTGKLSTRADIGEFYLRRLARIAPLFYAMSLFQYLLHYPLFWVLGNPGAALLNVTFLFNLSSKTVDPIALAGWSVGVEMLFYLLLPLVLSVVTSVWRAAVFALVATIVAAAYTQALGRGEALGYVAHSLAFNLPFFAAGLLAFYLFRATPRGLGLAAIGAGLLGLPLLWQVAMTFGGAIAAGAGHALYQAAWGIPFGLLCIGLALRPTAILANPVTRFLGRISFGLYLAHPHVLAALDARHVYTAIRAAPGGPVVHFGLAVLVTAAVLIPTAWLLYVAIERPGMALGRYVAHRSADSWRQKRTSSPGSAADNFGN